MIFKAVLNGCASNIAAQAEELNGFIDEHLGSADNTGSTILFYSPKEQKNELVGLVPTESATLVKITRYQPENILEALETIEHRGDTHLYLFPSGFAGSELAVRWAFRMNGSSLVQVNQIECLREHLIVKKMVYANNALGIFRLTKKPYCISPARGSTDGRSIKANNHPIVSEYDMTQIKKDRFVKASKWVPGETVKNLEETRFLIIGGRGMNSKENTDQLKKMAHDMGADFGVSRPVAMNAWAPMNRLIGVSGSMTKPDVCIVAGASGAAAFYAGIARSKYIVAVNTDKRAPIVRSADVVIIDDYKAIMTELVKIMKGGFYE